MTVAFIQPYGLKGGGGGSRILRNLLPSLTEPFVSICTDVVKPLPLAEGLEIHVPPRPSFGRLERSRLYNLIAVAEPLFENRLTDLLEDALKEHRVDRVHAVAHGLHCCSAMLAARRLDLPFYVSVHDHILEIERLYREAALEKTGAVWQSADALSVIGEALAEDYCLRFGRRDYTIITDGCSNLPEHSRYAPTNQAINIYFMGFVHFEYRRNFQSFNDGLQLLRSKLSKDTSFIIRGSQNKKFFAGVEASLLPWGTDADVQADIEKSDLLYMPLPFSREKEFQCRYSLSTKMVSYLGSGLPIIYHGPEYSAACKLLKEYEAAIIIPTENSTEICDALVDQLGNAASIAENGLRLARERFDLGELRDKFGKFITSDRRH